MDSFVQKGSVEYILQFSIWKYLTIRDKIVNKTKELDSYELKRDKEYKKLISEQQRYFTKLRKLKEDLLKFNEDLFNDSQCVDRDELFKVDY